MYKPKLNTSVLNHKYKRQIKSILDNEDYNKEEGEMYRWELYSLMYLGTNQQSYAISRWLLSMKVYIEQKVKANAE